MFCRKCGQLIPHTTSHMLQFEEDRCFCCRNPEIEAIENAKISLFKFTDEGK